MGGRLYTSPAGSSIHIYFLSSFGIEWMLSKEVMLQCPFVVSLHVVAVMSISFRGRRTIW